MSKVALGKWLAAPSRTIIVVDDDPATRAVAHAFVGRHANLQLSEFDDSRLGFKAADASSADLIVMGWKLRGLSGTALFNRLRMHHLHASTPILVVSDAVKRKDFRLLDEFPCVRLEEKPLSEPRLAIALGELVDEKDWLTRNQMQLEQQFVDAKGNPAALLASLKHALASSPHPVPLTLLIGEVLMGRKQYGPAEQVFRHALGRDAKSLMALSGLGRALYKQGKHDEAAAQLRVATRESQANVGRLCLLGELELTKINPDVARKHFMQALAIDDASPRAQAGVDLCTSLDDYIRHHASVAQPHSFAALCNTMAISLVRAGQMEKGMTQYRAALQLISDPYAAAQVMFNLGLGYLRWRKADEAKRWFEAADAKSGGRLAKARRYRDAVVRATGGKVDAFDLATIDQEMAAQTREQEETLFESDPLDKGLTAGENALINQIFEEERF